MNKGKESTDAITILDSGFELAIFVHEFNIFILKVDTAFVVKYLIYTPCISRNVVCSATEYKDSGNKDVLVTFNRGICDAKLR